MDYETITRLIEFFHDETLNLLHEFHPPRPVPNPTVTTPISALPCPCTLSLRLLQSTHLRRLNYVFSEETLTSLEILHQFHNNSVSLQSAYSAVAVYLTVRLLQKEDVSGFAKIVNSLWRNRIGDLEKGGEKGLVAEGLRRERRTMEMALCSEMARKELMRRDVSRMAADAVKIFLKEAVEGLGLTRLEIVSKVDRRREALVEGGDEVFLAPSTQNEASSSFSFLKWIILGDWWLTISEKNVAGKRLAVGGYHYFSEKTTMHVFTSAPIMKIANPFTIETADGFTLRLQGSIIRSQMQLNGFPPEVSNYFFSGFPYNWEYYAIKDFESIIPSSAAVPISSANSNGTTGNAELRKQLNTCNETSQTLDPVTSTDDFSNALSSHDLKIISPTMETLFESPQARVQRNVDIERNPSRAKVLSTIKSPFASQVFHHFMKKGGKKLDACSKRIKVNRPNQDFGVVKPSIVERNPTACTLQDGSVIAVTVHEQMGTVHASDLNDGPNTSIAKEGPIEIQDDEPDTWHENSLNASHRESPISKKKRRVRGPKEWTPDEEDALRKAVTEFGAGNINCWTLIWSTYPEFECRTVNSLRRKWLHMKEKENVKNKFRAPSPTVD